MNSGEIDYSKKLAEVDEELNEEDYSKKLKEINETPTENETKTYYYPQNGNEISHRESFSLEENINEVPPVSNNQDLQRRSLTVRILSIVDAIFSLYCLFLKRWMVAGGVFFALIGFWGALKYQKYFVLVYLCYLPVSLLIQSIYAFQSGTDPLDVTFSTLLLLIEAFIFYYVYNFYKLLPTRRLIL